uniref:type I protein arginine methyltransferase n=1 Tax=Globodera pallida TaxID=36090 RepID=A0A183C6T9_GLOPA
MRSKLATFRSILDANANPRGAKTESKQIVAKLAETRSKKRKCSDESAANDSNSEFDTRTEQSSAVQYFQFYGSLFQQQNMLQDFTRTATYQRAIFENWHEFRGKVVLDVGAGTGILSFFAAQVGAKRIYAVEASSMAVHCKELVHANGYDAVITVLSAKIEEIELPEQVDVIVSEPMGYMLVNERMLESYMYARKFLRNGGRMFPSRADLHLALFSDEALHQEQQQRAAFWAQQTFHGVTLDVLQQPALDELFRQPVVDSWGAGIFGVAKRQMDLPFTMNAQRTGHIAKKWQQVTGAVFMTTAVLADFELCFFDRSERWHGAVASIERKPGTRVWGCVWRVPNSLAAELDEQEYSYRRLDVDVTIHNDSGPSIPPLPMRCRTYQYSNPDRKLNRPSPHYRQVIITGALEHGLPSAYVEWIVNSFPTNDYRGQVELKLKPIEHLNSADNEHREQQQQNEVVECPSN